MGRVHAVNLLLAAGLCLSLGAGAALARSAAARSGAVGGSASNITYGPPASNAAASAVANTASSVGAAVAPASGSSGVNPQALANEAVSGAGAGGVDAGAVTTSIEALNVETGQEPRPTCSAYRSVVRRLTVTAVCEDGAGRLRTPLALRRDAVLPLDDQGEVFECLRTESLSYRVLGSASAGRSPAPLGEGRCRPGEGLYHDGAGTLACRASPGSKLPPRRRETLGAVEGVLALEAPGDPVCVAAASANSPPVRP